MRRAVVAVVGTVAALVAGTAGAATATAAGVSAPQYWLSQWQMSRVWDDGARGQGVTVAEIDTGVADIPSVFGNRLLPGKDFGRLGGDGHVDREDPWKFGHGTLMASLIVGRPGEFGVTGMAPDAKLIPLAVPIAGTTDAADNDHVSDAIEYAADHGAKIISMSLGGVRRAGDGQAACPADEQSAVFHALSLGAIVFAASGNRGTSDNAVEEPGVCLGVVSVGAVDAHGTVADFSSRHDYLTLTAPGVRVASIGRDGQAYFGDGTSHATALASGAAADVWSKYPKLTGPQVVARLLATTDGHSDTRSRAYGFGRLDTYRAVTAHVAAGAPNPVWQVARPFVQRAAAETDHADPDLPPPPATPPARPKGTFSVGPPPGHPHGRLVGGVVLGAAGLLLLVLLLVAWRRRRSGPVAAADRLPDAASVPPDAASVPPDAAGVPPDAAEPVGPTSTGGVRPADAD